MSRTHRGGERRIRVRGERREPTDLRRLARALIDLARAQAEADAEAESKRKAAKKKSEPEAGGDGGEAA